MAGGYIKLDKDLSEDPRLLDMADVVAEAFTIQIDPDNGLSDGDTEFTSRDARDLWCDTLLGALIRLWRYADIHVRADDTLPLGVTALSQVMRIPAWIIRLYPTEWLEILEELDIVRLPGYCEKNNIIPRDTRRLTGKERTRKWRENLREKRDAESASRPVTKRVTSSSPRRRGDATPVPVTGTQTGTHPIPVPVSGKEQQRQPSAAAELASAQEHLARRIPPEKSGNGAPRKSVRELEADAWKLSRAGLSISDIVRNLGQHGVTSDQVTAWLSNAPPLEAEAS